MPFRMKKTGKKKYFTTTLPYPNADLHLGHVFENVCMDARVRFERLRGFEVLYNTGADEFGTKIQQAAREKGVGPQQFVDMMSARFEKTLHTLYIRPDMFTRTTGMKHQKGAQMFWKQCLKNGWIYKAKHSGQYCPGCEFFLTGVDHSRKNEKGQHAVVCPLHPTTPTEYIEEENYFFALSKATDILRRFYKSDVIFPSYRVNEIFGFLEKGLEDISISRDKSRLSWGVPVPDDPTQVMYVWFDALTNYITTIGWPDESEWEEWWPVIQSAGKDNLKPQCIIWQAMLYAAGLPFSKQIYIHGNINDGQGRKMSKSLGNGITPAEIVEYYDVDTLRFLMIGYVHPFEDTAFSLDGVFAVYTDDLVNGIGNATARVLTLSHKYLRPPTTLPNPTFPEEYVRGFESFDFRSVADAVRATVRRIDVHLTTEKPFETIKTDPERARRDIETSREYLINLAYLLIPLIPATAEKIQDAVRMNTPPPLPLFPRKNRPGEVSIG